LRPRVLLGSHKNAGRLAVLYGPLVLAADDSLSTKDTALDEIGVASTNLADLQIVPESAPEEFKTWPGARVFRLNAVERNAGSLLKDRPLSIRLVPFADAGTAGSRYKIWLPCQRPAPDRNLLLTGAEGRSRKPNAGSIIDGDLQTIATTFNNKRAAEDWFSVTLEEPSIVRRVVFTHGQTFHNGGWFDASTGAPYVQVQLAAGGPWETVAELKEYPATTATDPAGLKAGERFSCVLPEPLKIVAIRVVGKPSCGDNAKQCFSSCAELEAFQSL
jgi:hypothetical protein